MTPPEVVYVGLFIFWQNTSVTLLNAVKKSEVWLGKMATLNGLFEGSSYWCMLRCSGII
eukprot:m.194546 g.194546  ORF g.194546 m.194546 type:complete len:59 (+) comp39500_c0_seq35:1177-1353(+)